MSVLPHDNPFPPPETADEDGLLAVGGELSPHWLLAAYYRGIFPWPVQHRGKMWLAWFSPDPRAVIDLDELHVSRRLARTLRSGRFTVTENSAFEQVIAHCAVGRERNGGTWITPEMIQAYTQLHQAGHAHSVEVWREDRLAGGIYGVSLGGLFAGESMFHLERDASKVALAELVARLRERGFGLLDVQMRTDHLASMGAKEIPRREFLRRLREIRDWPSRFATSPT